MVRRTIPQMCNRTSGNLEIPGSRFARIGQADQCRISHFDAVLVSMLTT
jgi:hypothetical protein